RLPGLRCSRAKLPSGPVKTSIPSPTTEAFASGCRDSSTMRPWTGEGQGRVSPGAGARAGGASILGTTAGASAGGAAVLGNRIRGGGAGVAARSGARRAARLAGVSVVPVVGSESFSGSLVVGATAATGG